MGAISPILMMEAPAKETIHELTTRGRTFDITFDGNYIDRWDEIYTKGNVKTGIKV